jgi:hypothetical protein
MAGSGEIRSHALPQIVARRERRASPGDVCSPAAGGARHGGMGTSMQDSAAARQARSWARQLLVADGVVVLVAGALVVAFASWLGGALVVAPTSLIVAVGAIAVVWGAALTIAVGRSQVRRWLLLATVVVNVVWVVGVGLLLGVAGGEMPERGRWLLTASAVVAGTFAALEWLVPRRFLP